MSGEGEGWGCRVVFLAVWGFLPTGWLSAYVLEEEGGGGDEVRVGRRGEGERGRGREGGGK